MVTTAQATAEDVLRLAGEGQSYELVDGELIEMAPTGFVHGDTESRFDRRLGDYVDSKNLGKVVVGDVLFQLSQEPRIARAPDVAFIRRDRLPQKLVHGPFIGAPDLAVEIVSPGDTASEIQKKTEQWLKAGVIVVLVVYLDPPAIVFWRGAEASRLSIDDELELDPVVLGFRCKVRDLFPPEIGGPIEEGD